MDPRLLNYYNRELQFIRESGAEFAEEFPKVAARLGITSAEVNDPYVERLLEGFAFLAARVQLQIDSEFPRFSQYMLELVYPNYLAPTPSMAVVQFTPDLSDSVLAEGFSVPRGTTMQNAMRKGEKTNCTYRTGHDVQLWPVELTEAKYFSSVGALATTGIETDLSGVKAAIRLRLRSTAGLAFDELQLDKLQVFLKGSGEIPKKLYEQLVADNLKVVVRPKGGADPWEEVLPAGCIEPAGFSENEALLPSVARAFAGYRLLQEYFAFPERFLFVDISGLSRAVRRCSGTELEIMILLGRSDSVVDASLTTDMVALNCVPVINLLQKRAVRIQLDDRTSEYHVVTDRTRPLDYELYSITEVQGFSRGSDPEQEFLPFYSSDDFAHAAQDGAYYISNRDPRMPSQSSSRKGQRSSYIGSEVFLGLVNGKQMPMKSSMRQIEVQGWFTNRDLPLQLRLGEGQTDFTLDTGAPVVSIRCVAGPSKPRESKATGQVAWRLISQLSLNYLSIVDSADGHGAAALRELLWLYADENDAATTRQIEGMLSVASRPITRRLPVAGPVTYARGLEIRLKCDDAAFEGTGAFLLTAVLEAFFSRYTSINSFTETVLETTNRGEVMRWPVRLGRRQSL